MTSNGYRLGEEIGRGALGRVVRVYGGDSEVYAGKILHGSYQGDARARSRFASEAAFLSEIRHENIVRVYGIENIASEEVMRMELVEGPNLAKLLAIEGHLDSERLISIACGLTGGLQAAHVAGLVHRDLKPQNILLTSAGVPKIADFGMARATSFAGVDESAFAVAGTPDYMAPECVDPLAVDARSDLYSLGCILFELATGRPPFSGATSFAVLEAHQRAAIPSIEADIPQPLVALIRALLAKSPSDRPQSAAAVERSLRALEQGDSTALALFGSGSLATTGRCVSCGDSFVATVSVCFGCKGPRVALEAGQHSVFIVGPGEVGDKLDAGLRQQLLAWFEANPSCGLVAEPLAKKVPRLPFVVVTRISEASARALATAMEAIGLQCTVQRGGAFRLPALRKKSYVLSGRLLAIGAASSAGLYGSLGALIVPFLGVGLLASASGGWYLASKGIAKKDSPPAAGLPLAIAASLAGVTVVVAGMSLQRHRAGLRGIVERVLSLCEKLPSDTLLECEDDLARLIDIALVACARMDEIEVALASADMRNPSPLTLEQVRERDRLAGQLLEVTAFLDSMRARTAALHHVGSDGRSTADRIDELRAHIAALEEVQEL